MTKMLRFLRTAGSSAVVYFATLVGVLLSQYAPLLLANAPLNTAFSWVRLGISAGVAFYLVAGQEEGGDQAGKDAHFKRRVANALAQGVAWNSIMGIAGQAAGAGS